MTATKPWRMFCSHGAVLFYIAQHPGCTNEEIAGALVVTAKTAWRLVRTLRQSGMIEVRREGRQNRHWTDREGRLPDPVLSHLTLRQIMNALGR